MRICVLTLLVAMMCVSTTMAQESKSEQKELNVPKETQEKPLNFWMAHKLDYSKTILESLTMGDFEKLAITAEQLRVLGKIEGFVRRKNPTYQIQLRNFDLATRELVRHAKQSNADGATLAFNQLTASCVSCHTLLRKGID